MPYNETQIKVFNIKNAGAKVLQKETLDGAAVSYILDNRIITVKVDAYILPRKFGESDLESAKKAAREYVANRTFF
jgi:hypothetical protein